MKTQVITLELYSESDIKTTTTLVDKLNAEKEEDDKKCEVVKAHNKNVTDALAPLFINVINKLAKEIDPALRKDKIKIEKLGSEISVFFVALYYKFNKTKYYNLVLSLETEDVLLNDGKMTKLIVPNNVSVNDIKLKCTEYLMPTYIIDNDSPKFISDYTEYLKYKRTR